MLILHRYLTRDLLRTFGMTALVLTGLVVMGGGVSNLFRGEGVGAEDLAKTIILFTPIALTIILPVAALFAAAITYGRSAADNEMLAASAAGINVLRLLTAALVLGLIVTGFTYWSWNHLLPSLLGRIEAMTRRDLHKIVIGQFEKAKPLAYGKYRLMAEKFEVIDAESAGMDLPANHVYLRLRGVAFLEVEDQEVLRYGTADETIIDVDQTQLWPTIKPVLTDVRSFDARHRQYVEVANQPLPTFEIPRPTKRKIKFEPLDRLLTYRTDPRLIPDVQELIIGLRRSMMLVLMAEDIRDGLKADGRYVLEDEQTRYEITAQNLSIDKTDGMLSLRDVVILETRNGETRRYAAGRADFAVRSSSDDRGREEPDIQIELRDDVTLERVPAGAEDRQVRKPTATLPRVAYMEQPRLKKVMDEFDMDKLLAGKETRVAQKQDKGRIDVNERMTRMRSEVVGEIHFRASYSLNAMAIILFGAILGIIARGGQVLTAFGISCIPMVFVIVTSIVGRNLADTPSYLWISITVMWGATAAMYAATAIISYRYLPR